MAEEEKLRREEEYNSPAAKAQRDLQQAHDVLTDIATIGDVTARTITDQYPSIRSIKLATEKELVQIPGVGIGLARAIKARTRKIEVTVNNSQPGEKIKTEFSVINCPECSSKLRIPAGKKGKVTCPKCGHSFFVQAN